jgi:POT family proton-dependent oligopeptide transporter
VRELARGSFGGPVSENLASDDILDVAPRRSRWAFFDQPRGVLLIASTEFWERFSYYGFIGLIALFMTAAPVTGGLGLDKALTLKLFGVTTGCMFMAPSIGGWISDRLIGPFLAVVLGCIGLACGNFLLAAAGTLAAHQAGAEMTFFYAGLVVMVAGAGLFKSNVSALLGQLYAEGDKRRQDGFMLFYMGINLGAFAAPYGAGTIGELKGWSYGFLVSGIGMAIGLLAFLWMSRGLFMPYVRPGRDGVAAAKLPWSDPGVRLILVMIVFAAIYMVGQQTYGGVMNLYVRDRVSHDVLGFHVPTTWFLSLNPLVVILGGPFVSRYWTAKLGASKRLAALDRILWGTVLMALSYVLMGLCDVAAGQGLVAPIWIVVFYIVITIAELCVFPIGLAEISRRAPREMVGLLMGFWVFTMGFGSLMAGWLGGVMADAPTWLIFAVLAGGGLLNALALVLVEPLVRRRVTDIPGT